MTDPSPETEVAAWQHRVIYTREGWSKGRFRYFARLEEAEAFAEEMQGDDRPEVARLRQLSIHSRPVGPWTKRKVLLDQ